MVHDHRCLFPTMRLASKEAVTTDPAASAQRITLSYCLGVGLLVNRVSLFVSQQRSNTHFIFLPLGCVAMTVHAASSNGASLSLRQRLRHFKLLSHSPELLLILRSSSAHHVRLDVLVVELMRPHCDVAMVFSPRGSSHRRRSQQTSGRRSLVVMIVLLLRRASGPSGLVSTRRYHLSATKQLRRHHENPLTQHHDHGYFTMVLFLRHSFLTSRIRCKEYLSYSRRAGFSVMGLDLRHHLCQLYHHIDSLTIRSSTNTLSLS